jgi:hypothetical protein
MIEVLAEQLRAEMIQDTHKEIERIYQELAQLERHQRRPVNPVLVKHKQQPPPATLKGIIKDAMDQAAKEERLSGKKKKKMWLLLAERLEEAHRLGIYKEPVNTICRFICLIYPSAKPNTIRKALPYKYKEPNQSKIACRQMKGLTASIWRHNRKKKMMASNIRHWPQVSERASPKKIGNNSSVTPYKDMAHNSYYTSFASWLRRCKKKKYNNGIFEKIKQDKAFPYLCRDREFALWYLEEVYHPTAKELFTVRKAMEIFNHEKDR